jgi:arylsulfatase A-like enzyme
LHATNWTVREMCRTIKRRDPTRPSLWYISFNFPHPPLVPLAAYLDLYRSVDIAEPFVGAWAKQFERLPFALKKRHRIPTGSSAAEMKYTRRAFYALCTHIDHQIRLVVGMLREEGLLDNTIIGFTADHGEMLGNHGLYAKGVFYEDSAKVPLVLVPTAEYGVLGHHRTDDRLVELRDVMPTLLEMAGIPVPDTVEGISLLADTRREYLYGEYEEGDAATRMLRNERYKLIYYPVGHRVQLFDMEEDPDELNDLADDPNSAPVHNELLSKLVDHLYGSDLDWIVDGQLVGLPEKPFEPAPNRTLSSQRGWRFM